MILDRTLMNTAYNCIKYNSRTITKEFAGTCRYYKANAYNGWNTGARLSKIKKFTPLKSFSTKFLGALSKTKVKLEHIPTLLSGVGTIVPVPGGTFLGYGLGKLINKAAKVFVK